jgi:hypothetical protein
VGRISRINEIIIKKMNEIEIGPVDETVIPSGSCQKRLSPKNSK